MRSSRVTQYRYENSGIPKNTCCLYVQCVQFCKLVAIDSADGRFISSKLKWYRIKSDNIHHITDKEVSTRRVSVQVSASEESRIDQLQSSLPDQMLEPSQREEG